MIFFSPLFAHKNHYLAVRFPFSLVGLRCAFFLSAAPRQSYYPHYRKKEGIMLLFYFATLYITVGVLCHILPDCFKCLTVFLQRGKTVPEELVRAEDLSKYHQVASHAVSIDFCLSTVLSLLIRRLKLF